MPNLKPSSDDLFSELERYVALIKQSRAKDLEECEQIESILLRYKAARNEDQRKAATALNGHLSRVEASLDNARNVIRTVRSRA